MTDILSFVSGILENPDDFSRPLVFSDWLEENEREGNGKWLRFAIELAVRSWPAANDSGFANNYAIAMQRLSARRGGNRLGWIGRLASWHTVTTTYGIAVADLLDDPELRLVQARRLELCGVPTGLFAEVPPSITLLLGDKNRQASVILTDRAYMESAARFFDTIRLPRGIPTVPDATGPGHSSGLEPGPV